MSACVVVYYSPANEPMYEHEKVTLHGVARRIAELKGCHFAGLYKHGGRYPAETFFVPDETLDRGEAGQLGIGGPADLFGGVVPHSFVRSKAITHPLVEESAARPPGWSSGFPRRVSDSVLPGFTAFSAGDARIAARRLSSLGTVRLKRAFSAGGGGQGVAGNDAEMEAFLQQVPHDELAQYGLVLEPQLDRIATLSIGQVALDDMLITYHGTQRVVTNNAGHQVYGGSELTCMRGDWDALEALPIAPEIRLAIDQARRYDAAMTEYPGFVASRRNYDVAQGMDAAGRHRSGVLEASWRSGGASTAELEALALFMGDPELRVVEVCAVKHFGAGHEPPQRAVVHFAGNDPRDGPIMRYTVVTRTLRAA